MNALRKPTHQRSMTSSHGGKPAKKQPKTGRKPVSAMKGSREKRGATLPEKLTVKWAPDVYDPIPTSVSHIVITNNRKNSKFEQMNENKSSRGKPAKKQPTTGRKPVSAMKGSREQRGATPPEKLTVKWAPDVYDPVPTSVSHMVMTNNRRRSKKNSKFEKMNENKSSRRKSAKKQPKTDRKLVSAMKDSREKRGVTPPEKLTVKWAPDVYDPVPTSVSHMVITNNRQRSKENSKFEQMNENKSSRGNKYKDKIQCWKGGDNSTAASFKPPEHEEEVVVDYGVTPPTAMEVHVDHQSLIYPLTLFVIITTYIALL